MTFELYRRPGGVVFLDDDRDYLEMLAEVMPADWHARFFLRPVACIETLLKEKALRESDAWRQQAIVNRWGEGAALIPQILQYWRDDAMQRFALTRVCVVDYAMPAMSGLRVLGELTEWTGSRILLTGRGQLAAAGARRQAARAGRDGSISGVGRHHGPSHSGWKHTGRHGAATGVERF